MARIAKGTKRYLLFRGKDENGNDILIDIFSKKELDEAVKEERVREEDHIVKVELIGRTDVRKPKQRRKR